MSRHISFVHNERPPGSPVVDRRFSALDAEEREVEMPAEVDLSQVSTLAPDSDERHTYRHSLVAAATVEDDTTGWSTPATDSSTPPQRADESSLARHSSVMQVKKVTKQKWSEFPRKGYKTTTKYFYEEIDGHWTVALIVVCFFVSGIVDAVTYRTYSVFAMLQTGNTVILALQISNRPVYKHSFAYLKSIVAVASYCLGGLFFNVLHRGPSDLANTRPRLHRWTLFTSFVVQSALLIVSAALAQAGWTSTKPLISGGFSSGSSRNPEGRDNYLDLIPIGFLAFESAGQVCLSRVLLINELPTIVISTLYHDFIADALCWRQLWLKRKSTWDFFKEQKRQVRRALCVVALFVGALIGGFVYSSRGGIGAALWIAAGSKVVVSVAFCLWRRKVVTETVVTHDSPPKPS